MNKDLFGPRSIEPALKMNRSKSKSFSTHKLGCDVMHNFLYASSYHSLEMPMNLKIKRKWIYNFQFKINSLRKNSLQDSSSQKGPQIFLKQFEVK